MSLSLLDMLVLRQVLREMHEFEVPGASIVDISDDDEGDIDDNNSDVAENDETGPSSNTSSVNLDDYKFIEISGSPTMTPFYGGGEYTFTRPGRKPLPGLLSAHFGARGKAQNQQVELFKHTRALNLRNMQPRCAPGVMALFPNVTSIIRQCNVPLPMPVFVMVDVFCLTKDFYVWKSLPEIQTNPAHDDRPSIAPGPHKLEKHVLYIEYYPMHPRLASANIEVTLPDNSANELVFIFAPGKVGGDPNATTANIRLSSQPCGMLNGVVAALCSSIADKYTLVGADDIPRAAINLKKKDRRRDKILKAVRNGAARDPHEFVSFLSHAEYRARVGKFQYSVETDGEL